ncbi:uncharacterized protein AB675_221 [Cyphellophora attinorum]|uniref:Uncharacterized protein n=1 Tax=Cyphellophora attinorum TaxID=1664694 RepID=A0A0N1H5K9_9EURO|nr:uncharacterized protein AB675_221 [Phialophora attinorum]KPI37710.1 hypothetical protein AB675_221 [Phialophora attinorum]
MPAANQTNGNGRSAPGGQSNDNGQNIRRVRSRGHIQTNNNGQEQGNGQINDNGQINRNNQSNGNSQNNSSRQNSSMKACHCGLCMLTRANFDDIFGAMDTNQIDHETLHRILRTDYLNYNKALMAKCELELKWREVERDRVRGLD